MSYELTMQDSFYSARPGVDVEALEKALGTLVEETGETIQLKAGVVEFMGEPTQSWIDIEYILGVLAPYLDDTPVILSGEDGEVGGYVIQGGRVYRGEVTLTPVGDPL